MGNLWDNYVIFWGNYGKIMRNYGKLLGSKLLDLLWNPLFSKKMQTTDCGLGMRNTRPQMKLEIGDETRN